MQNLPASLAQRMPRVSVMMDARSITPPHDCELAAEGVPDFGGPGILGGGHCHPRTSISNRVPQFLFRHHNAGCTVDQRH